MDRFRQHEWSIALRELEMQREHIRRLMDHPLQNVMNEIDAATRLHQTLRASSVLTAMEMTRLQVRPEQWSPLHDLLRAERAINPSAELNAARQIQLQYEQSRLPDHPLGMQWASELLQAQEQLKALTRSATFNIIREAQERYNTVRFFTELSNLAAMADLTIRSMKAFQNNQFFSQTFAGSIIDSLSSLQGYRGYEEFRTHLDKIERLFEERIRSNPHGSISLFGILEICLAVVLSIAEILTSNQGENRILERLADNRSSIEYHIDSRFKEMGDKSHELDSNIIRRFEEFGKDMMDKCDALKPKSETKIFYVATRTVNIRSDPSKKSPAIAKLHGNQKVALIASKEEWIYIEYFDYINAIPKMGWVYGEYLKRLPEEGK
jgi:hypothetical protein